MDVAVADTSGIAVMNADEDAVGCQMNIRFDSIRVSLHGELEGTEGVFGSINRLSPV